MKIQLVALRDHSYGGRRIKAGQEYCTGYRHGAEMLIKLGHADFAPAQQQAAEAAAEPTRGAGTDEATIVQPAPASQAGEASAPAAEPPAPPCDDKPTDAAPEQPAAPAPDPAPAEQAPKRRQYRRRDMTAEGSAD